MNLSPEEFADAAAATLFAELPAALAAQTARHAATDEALGITVELAAPAWEDYHPGGVQVVTAYPTVEVAVPDMLAGNFSIDGYDADVQFTLVVRVFDRDADHQTLYRKMNRLVAAVVGTLTRRGALSDAEVSGLRVALRFNPETEEQDHVVSGVLIALTCETVMTRA